MSPLGKEDARSASGQAQAKTSSTGSSTREADRLCLLLLDIGAQGIAEARGPRLWLGDNVVERPNASMLPWADLCFRQKILASSWKASPCSAAQRPGQRSGDSAAQRLGPLRTRPVEAECRSGPMIQCPVSAQKNKYLGESTTASPKWSALGGSLCQAGLEPHMLTGRSS